MKVRVLGSAAGGGFPQWNCNCRNCAALRGGRLRGRARTQSSIAVASGASWALVNASPDVTAQLQACPALQPARALRDTAIAAIVLVDGQVDHTTGLYMLREAVKPWPIWCTDGTYADLTSGNPILRVLAHYCGVERRRIDLGGGGFAVDGMPRVHWLALAVASKPAPYSPHRDAPVAGDNIALLITDEGSGKRLLYAPGLAAIDDGIWRAMQASACVLIDGTFWSEEEMIEAGVSQKRARDLGHLPQSGPGGTLEWLERLPAATRKILIHINNTNPILDEDSGPAAQLARRGIEIAWDGMEIDL
ncbi:MAG TPA: pyrroloquinoline quinone biosynthesis protein PqqB [Steroidobacteraceae bacterium]|nr:pyrroloquinoline quinone biosynthesis protein PqqB [Steroidobacteraceae bacterium]